MIPGRDETPKGVWHTPHYKIMTTTTYYHKPSSNDQGTIIDEQTGRTVAVVYDAKDAPLLAAAPALRDALQRLADAAYSFIHAENVTPDLMDELKQAMGQSYAPLADAPYTA